ncbi:MAG: hypothetical protein EBX71_11875, partial [Betaproteobacteria bacterium]|nr:hypothetical protein [Betaproteobacteria bacterium]
MNKPVELHGLSANEGSPDPRLLPYAKPQPWGMVPDMIEQDVLTEDERLWAPIGEQSWSRPIHLNTTEGFYVHLLKVK